MALQQVHHKPLLTRSLEKGSRPASYLLLLAAVDQGWRIVNVELALAKDRSGLIYVITMQHADSSVNREMLLPRTPLTEKLLADLRMNE